MESGRGKMTADLEMLCELNGAVVMVSMKRV